MTVVMTRLQRQALQRYAVAAAERERARRHMAVCEQTMREAQREATRHGNLDLPVTATLNGGGHVTIDTATGGESGFLRYTVAPGLDVDESEIVESAGDATGGTT